MSEDETNTIDVKMWILIGGFILSFSAAIGSYFKAVSDIRNENQASIYQVAEKIRLEMSSNYATKIETTFTRESLMEIKSDIKEIKGRLEARK